MHKRFRYSSIVLLILMTALCTSITIQRIPAVDYATLYYEQFTFIPTKYRDFLIQVCYENAVPLRLVTALVEVESEWVEDAIRYNYKRGKLHSTDKGLLQINSKNITYFSTIFFQGKHLDPMNYRSNLESGVKYLRWLYDRTHNWRSAAIAFHIGLTNFKQGKLKTSAKSYISKVSALYKDWE